MGVFAKQASAGTPTFSDANAKTFLPLLHRERIRQTMAPKTQTIQSPTQSHPQKHIHNFPGNQHQHREIKLKFSTGISSPFTPGAGGGGVGCSSSPFLIYSTLRPPQTTYASGPTPNHPQRSCQKNLSIRMHQCNRTVSNGMESQSQSTKKTNKLSAASHSAEARSRSAKLPDLFFLLVSTLPGSRPREAPTRSGAPISATHLGGKQTSEPETSKHRALPQTIYCIHLLQKITASILLH